MFRWRNDWFLGWWRHAGFCGLNALTIFWALRSQPLVTVKSWTHRTFGQWPSQYDALLCFIWFGNLRVCWHYSTLVVDLATYAAHSPDSLRRTLFLGDCYWWAIYLDPQICLTQCISHQANITLYAIIIFLRRWRFVSLAPTFSCIASTCEGLDWKSLYATSLVYWPHYVAYVKMRQFSST